MLFLWSQNLGETDPLQVVVPFVAVVLGAALLTIVLGAVFRGRRRGALVASALVLGLFMYGHAAHIVARVHVPAFLQQAGWVALVVIAIIAAVRLDARRLAIVDTALDRLGAILVVVTLVLIVPFQVSTMSGAGSTAQVQPIATTTTAPLRDVYWLVFDRYGSDRSLKLRYGVDNDLTAWLQDHGFTVLADSHANYIRTVLSMSTTLQMATLDELAEQEGPESSDVKPVNALLQDPLVARQFKALGYRYHHVGGSWGPTRVDSGADVNYTVPSLPGGDFTEALIDASAIEPLANRLHIDLDSARERGYTFDLHGLDALAGLRDEPGPKFVVSHILLPHPPLVFDRDGSFMRRPGGRADEHDRAVSPPARLHEQPDRGHPRRPRRAAGGQAADHHPPGRRGSLSGLVWRRAQDRPGLGRRRHRGRARAEVRDPQRLVRAWRRGPRALARR